MRTELAVLRFRRDMTQEEVSEKVGRTPGTIRNWEEGRTAPTIEESFLYAETLGITVERLRELVQQARKPGKKTAARG